MAEISDTCRGDRRTLSHDPATCPQCAAEYAHRDEAPRTASGRKVGVWR